MPEFKSFKIRVNSPEHSEKIQKHLLNLGYEWSITKSKNISEENKSSPFLFAYSDGSVTSAHNLSQNYFKSHKNIEVELVETVSYEFKEIKKREVLKIGNNSYYMDELEIALKNINPI